jgi:Chalcone isomerase-like
MPEKVSVSGKQLRLNGIGVGKKAFFKVYVIALYLESPTLDARNAIKTDKAKRIVLTMLRDVSREKFVQAVEEDMERNPGVPMSALRGRLDRLESVLPALKKETLWISHICRSEAPWCAAKGERSRFLVRTLRTRYSPYG